jgi:hypothetical protein
MNTFQTVPGYAGGCTCADKTPTVPTCRDPKTHLEDCPAKDSGYLVGQIDYAEGGHVTIPVPGILDRRLTRAKTSLENWGRHFEWCAYWQLINDRPAECDCGLWVELNAMDELRSEVMQLWSDDRAEVETVPSIAAGPPSSEQRTATTDRGLT